jgi:hypothetical protein
MFTGNPERVEGLIANLRHGDSQGSYKRSFYDNRIFEEPTTTLHNMIRHPGYGPGRAYAAALLPVLIRNGRQLRLEVKAALVFEQYQGDKADRMLLNVLWELDTAL